MLLTFLLTSTKHAPLNHSPWPHSAGASYLQGHGLPGRILQLTIITKIINDFNYLDHML